MREASFCLTNLWTQSYIFGSTKFWIHKTVRQKKKKTHSVRIETQNKIFKKGRYTTKRVGDLTSHTHHCFTSESSCGKFNFSLAVRLMWHLISIPVKQPIRGAFISVESRTETWSLYARQKMVSYSSLTSRKHLKEVLLLLLNCGTIGCYYYCYF